MTPCVTDAKHIRLCFVVDVTVDRERRVVLPEPVQCTRKVGSFIADRLLQAVLIHPHIRQLFETALLELERLSNEWCHDTGTNLRSCATTRRSEELARYAQPDAIE
jgi:hypothetical protein